MAGGRLGPADPTFAREGRIYVQLLAEGNVIGELTAPLHVAR